MQIQNQTCVMIKTKDRRVFYTFKENLPDLNKFAKVFNANVSIVKVDQAEVLNLTELAQAFCSANPDQSKRDRNILLKNSKIINDHIENLFRNGQIVSLKQLVNNFQKIKVSTACICNHISKIRKRLQKEGLKIVKLGGGKYQRD